MAVRVNGFYRGRRRRGFRSGVADPSLRNVRRLSGSNSFLTLNDAEWSDWSDSEIGRQCAVDHKTVKRLRTEHLGNSQDSGERTVKRNGKSYTMNTTAIGKSAPRLLSQF